MSTHRALFRSLLIAVAGVSLAACVVHKTSANGANPGYGSPSGNETRDHRSGDGDETSNPCGGTVVEAGAVGQPCGEGDACAEGLECMRYYGIAGANGPEFTSCEMRCDGGCPDGLQCTTISDGPGQVCRPGDAPAGQATAAQGEKCSEGVSCADGFQCVEYYGFAGPSGPKFTSCEMPCGNGETCPMGQACTTISDGPGQVCRPTGK